MTPDEKAKELYDTFFEYTFNPNDHIYSHKAAQTCALLCCDEILSLRMIYSMGRGLDEIDSEGQFYEKVKESITNLK
jgi:hypothetical protein